MTASDTPLLRDSVTNTANTANADNTDSADNEELRTRGRTTIADRVVERIAVHAAGEVEGVGGSAHRVLGVRVSGEAPERAVHADARVSGGTASLRMQLSVRYPNPVARTVEQARDHIVRTVTALTGLAVSRVNVTVTALHAETERRRNVQ